MCFVVDGPAEMETAKSLLEALHSRIDAGDSSAPPRVRVILVLTAVYDTDTRERLISGRGLTDPDRELLPVVDLRGRRQLSGPALFAPLQRRIFDELQQSRSDG